MSRDLESGPVSGVFKETTLPPRVKRGHWRRALGKYEGWTGFSLALVALEQKLDQLAVSKNFELAIQIERLINVCGGHLSGVKQINPRVAEEATNYLNQVRVFLDKIAAASKTA